jgi:hypothetical protein
MPPFPGGILFIWADNMNKVYKHKPSAIDEYLGHVDLDGHVYETHLGPDKYIGHVEIGTGKIFETRFGPDKYIGHVELDSGKGFISKFGPDEYIGRVQKDGEIYLQKQLAPDEYLGKIIDMTSIAHAGAALLLLLYPIYKEQSENQSNSS